MSQENPYQTSSGGNAVPPHQNFAPAGSGLPFDANLIRKVPVRPIELLQRAHSFLGDRYWLFVGITLIAVLVGSLVPFGIVTGALTVGVFLCLMEHEAGRRVDLSLVFKGFDYFLDSLIVVIALVVLSTVIIVPVMVVMMIMMIAVPAAIQGGGDAGAAGALVMFVLMVVFFAVMMLVSMLVYLPFLFSFQLIADQKLKASDALRLGWEGSKRNFGGLILLLLVFGLIGFVSALLCYIPLIFLLPLFFTAMFLLYRDVYRDVAPRPATAAVPPNVS